MIQFSYKRISTDFIRPIIPITLINGIKKVPLEALVDSGADYCIFDKEIAKALHLDLSKPESMSTITSFQGKTEPVSFYTVTLKIKDVEIRTKMGFTTMNSDWSHGLLGEVGFFSKFHVYLDFRREKIELNLHKELN